jgi:hypothetical protein
MHRFEREARKNSQKRARVGDLDWTVLSLICDGEARGILERMRGHGIFEPFIYKYDLFTKTGSGQTQGKLRNDYRFLRCDAQGLEAPADLGATRARAVQDSPCAWGGLRAGV